VLAFERFAQWREELGVAGSIGVQKRNQVRVGLAPGFFNRGAVAPILGEHDELNLIQILTRALNRPIGRAVADDSDVYVLAFPAGLNSFIGFFVTAFSS
jgi:hypothetical protein